VFAQSDSTNAVPEAAAGSLQVLGPNGPFTFIMDGVQYLGGPVGCGCMCLGQHCGLAFHFHGVHSSLCNAQYLLRNVTYDLTDPEQSRITQFGVSGGNPVLPSFHSFDDSLLGARSLVSKHLNGFADVPTCEKRSDRVWDGGYACQQPVRRLQIWSPDQGNLRLDGPGLSVTNARESFPARMQNNGWLKYNRGGGYGAVVVANHTYDLTLRQVRRKMQRS
jgi:hypothetical protein